LTSGQRVLWGFYDNNRTASGLLTTRKPNEASGFLVEATDSPRRCASSRRYVLSRFLTIHNVRSQAPQTPAKSRSVIAPAMA